MLSMYCKIQLLLIVQLYCKIKSIIISSSSIIIFLFHSETLHWYFELHLILHFAVVIIMITSKNNNNYYIDIKITKQAQQT